MPSTRRAEWMGGAVVVLFSILLAYFYYTGLYCSDDTRYLIGAIRIAIGEDISTTSLAERRVVLLLPAAAVYALTHDVDLSIAVYGLFFVGLGGVAYALARRFFGVPVAAAVAVLALAQPALFLYSGALMPDIAVAFWSAIALYFLCRWTAAVEVDGRGRSAPAFAAAAGASIAVAFTLKESGLVLAVIPAALVALGIARKRVAASITAACAMVLGFVGVLALEALLFRLTAGQWHSSVASLLAPHDFSGFSDMQGRTPLARMRSLHGELGTHTATLFLLASIASAQLLWECLKRRVGTQEAVAWLTVMAFWMWPTLYFTFGTASLSEYVLPVMQQRYYAPCIVPAALLTGRLFVSVGGMLRSGGALHMAAGGAVACGVLATILVAPYTERRGRGLIYGAAAKEAFELAVHDARRRYPEIPIIDTDSGWTTDINRCRLLLSHSIEGDDRMLKIIRSRRDLKGKFDYASLDRLETPFLIVGHGPFLSSPKPKSWVTKLKRNVARSNLQVDHVGSYAAPAYRDLRGRRWLPRQQAVQALIDDDKARDMLLPVEGAVQDEGARQAVVDVYLITSTVRTKRDQEVRADLRVGW